MIVAISAGAFVIILMLVWGAFDMLNLWVYGDQTRARRRLTADIDSLRTEGSAIDIVRKDALGGEDGILDTIFNRIRPIQRLKHLLKNADSDMPVSLFIIFSLVLGAAGCLLGLYGGLGTPIVTGMGLGGLSLPLFYQLRAKTKRLKAIEAQLPDALDLIARTLMAGHAFIMGLKLAAEQVEDPLAREFRQTFEEINFGVSVQEAMQDLSERIDSLDVKFFVTSLMVQLETGGNLAEIIGSISRLIRARFELFGKVRALSAEGRISALVMFSLPIVLGFLLFLINRDYMTLLFKDPIGKAMLTGGALMMMLGMFVTRRMVQIKV